MESRQQRNFEPYTLIWCAENTKQTEEIQIKLRQSINYFKAFSTVDECWEYIETNIVESLLGEDEKILLVISIDYLNPLMLHVHQLEQIIAVYIFAPMNHDEKEILRMKFNKVNANLF